MAARPLQDAVEEDESTLEDLAQDLRMACEAQPQNLEQIRSIVQRDPSVVWIIPPNTTHSEHKSVALHSACGKGASLEIVQYLVECWPDSVKFANKDGLIALHIACTCHSAHPDVVQYLVSQWPESVRVVSPENSLALHFACGNQLPLEVIKSLIQQWPGSVRAVNRDGCVPLHMACLSPRRAHQLQVIQYLLEQWPEAVMATNKDAWIALHGACFTQAPLELVRSLLQLWPESIKVLNKDQYLPLHIACSSNAPLEVIQYLVNQWPQSIGVFHNNDSIPLHFALRQQVAGAACSLGVIQWLVRQWPDSVMVRNKEGSVALHIACQNNAPLVVVDFLVQQWFGSVKSTDKNGWIAVQWACRMQAHLDVIRYLIQKWPDSIGAINNDNWSALHVACFGKASLETIRYLVQQWPGSVKTVGKNDWTPLHLVCRNHASLEVVQYLVNQWPASIKAVTKTGKMPLAIAISSKAPREVIDWLAAAELDQKRDEQAPESLKEDPGQALRDICRKHPQDLCRILDISERYPAAIRVPDGNKMLPLHHACGNHAPLDVIQYLIQQWPLSVKATTVKGWIPLHWACYKQSSLAVVQYLVEQWPESLSVVNNDNYFALQIACTGRARLEVIQYLVGQWPVSVTDFRKNTNSPLEIAKKAKAPLEVIKCLESVALETEPRLDPIRHHLQEMIRGKRRDPIELTVEYVNSIVKKDQELGKGFYGTVYRGFDDQTGHAFAVKLIDPKAWEGGSPDRIQGILSTFKREAQVLSKINHPNIAKLYGYCMSSERDNFLLYELAPKGSLDGFWKSTVRRQMLSSSQLRIKIALEVATVLCYMHRGLDGNAVCFHRDIKSANVCLAEDFQALVIDCGLSKYVDDGEDTANLSSHNGPIGTKGYICPEYNGDEIKYQSACDVFSFGVFLCELITGRTNPRGQTHYTVYEKKKTRSLIDDKDEFADWENDPDNLDEVVALALGCMHGAAEKRPLIEDIVSTLTRLYESLSGRKGPTLKSPARTQNTPALVCRTCGCTVTEQTSITCHGRTAHSHCLGCYERSLARCSTLERHRLTCLKDGCDSREFTEAEIASKASPSVWGMYQQTKLFWNFLSSISGRLNTVLHRQVTTTSLPPCPSLFILVEAGRPPRSWRRPREWTKNLASKKLYLSFVCGHSLQAVSDDCRIKLRYSKEWFKKVAPALKVSVMLLQAAAATQGMNLPVDMDYMKEMDEWAAELLEEPSTPVLSKQAHWDIGTIRDPESKLRNTHGPALSFIVDKARENTSWRRELGPVFDFRANEYTFIQWQYRGDFRYQYQSDLQCDPRHDNHSQWGFADKDLQGASF